MAVALRVAWGPVDGRGSRCGRAVAVAGNVRGEFRRKRLLRVRRTTVQVNDDRVPAQLRDALGNAVAIAREQENLRVLDQFIERADHPAGEMRDVFLDVIPVRAGDAGGFDAGVVYFQVVTLADEMLGDEDDRAFAQIVRAWLEGQTVQPDAAQAVVGDHVNGPF